MPTLDGGTRYARIMRKFLMLNRSNVAQMEISSIQSKGEPLSNATTNAERLPAKAPTARTLALVEQSVLAEQSVSSIGSMTTRSSFREYLRNIQRKVNVMRYGNERPYAVVVTSKPH